MEKRISLLCPCCSGNNYVDCCDPYLSAKQKAPTPEALMRSRYTAYARKKFAYLVKTMQGEALKRFDISAARQDALLIKWLKLEVLNAQESENMGWVEFKAHFRFQNKTAVLHELSCFEKINNEWFYMRGENK